MTKHNLSEDETSAKFITPALYQAGWSEATIRRQVKRLPIAAPPLAEQHRIVAKVDERMALCDQLKAQLTIAQTDNRCLLKAVLDAALTPT